MVRVIVGVLLGPWCFVALAAAVFGALALYGLSLAASAALIVAWGRRRDRRLGAAIGITLKSSSKSGAVK